MRNCALKTCHNHKAATLDAHARFHKLPSRMYKLRVWLEVIMRVNGRNDKHSGYICNAHFRPCDYSDKGRLVMDAEPSIYQCPGDSSSMSTNTPSQASQQHEKKENISHRPLLSDDGSGQTEPFRTLQTDAICSEERFRCGEVQPLSGLETNLIKQEPVDMLHPYENFDKEGFQINQDPLDIRGTPSPDGACHKERFKFPDVEPHIPPRGPPRVADSNGDDYGRLLVQKRRIGNLTTDDFCTIEKAKIHLKFVKDTFNAHRRSFFSEKKKLRRLQVKVKNMEDLLNNLMANENTSNDSNACLCKIAKRKCNECKGQK